METKRDTTQELGYAPQAKESKTPIEKELETVKFTGKELNTLLDELEYRLSSILTEARKEESKTVTTEVPSVFLAKSIRQANSNTIKARDRLKNILSRIAL